MAKTARRTAIGGEGAGALLLRKRKSGVCRILSVLFSSPIPSPQAPTLKEVPSAPVVKPEISESTMVFPKLEKESPASSTYEDVVKPAQTEAIASPSDRKSVV